jgi:hypothetical protein
MQRLAVYAGEAFEELDEAIGGATGRATERPPAPALSS